MTLFAMIHGFTNSWCSWVFDCLESGPSYYHDHIRQCEALGEFAMAEQIRQILVQEQDHQIDLATALRERFLILAVVPRGRAVDKNR